MFWYLTPPAIAVLVFIAVSRKAFREGDSLGSSLCAGLLSSLLCGVMASMLSAGFATALSPSSYSVGEYPEYQHQFEIIAAADSTLTEGRFYLFGGSIEEEPVYFYYRQSDDGSVRQGNLPTNRSVIYEDTAGDGYVEVWKECQETSFWRIEACGAAEYRIHVPPNSITRGFEFDLG